MALHVPVHHAGMAGSHLYRNLLVAILIAVVAVAAIGVAMSVRISPVTTSTVSQSQALIGYRAAERADWVAGMPTEGSSLIEFRAAERVGR